MYVGIPQIMVIPFIPRLMRKFESRTLISAGLVLFALSCLMNGFMSHDFSGEQMRWSYVCRALGVPLILSPIKLVVYDSMEQVNIASASAITNMMRLLGGSMGIGLLSTFLTHRYQFHLSRIVERMPASSLKVADRLNGLEAFFVNHGYSISQAESQARLALGRTVNREALVMAYCDCFVFLAFCVFISIPLVWCLKRNKAPAIKTAIAEH